MFRAVPDACVWYTFRMIFEFRRNILFPEFSDNSNFPWFFGLSRGANVVSLSCFHIWRVLVAPGLNTWLQNSRNFRIFPKSFWIFSGFFGAPQGPGMGPKCAPGGRLSNPEVSSESGQRRPDWWQKYILKKAQEPCIFGAKCSNRRVGWWRPPGPKLSQNAAAHTRAFECQSSDENLPVAA